MDLRYLADCTALESVSLPSATDIGNSAFSWCASLETVSLPTTPPSIGRELFWNIWDTAGTIIVSVPAGAVPAYTSAWGVDAETPAGGNTGVYGSGHKAITITDGVSG
jgi:hypothetical protein